MVTAPSPMEMGATLRGEAYGVEKAMFLLRTG